MRLKCEVPEAPPWRSHILSRREPTKTADTPVTKAIALTVQMIVLRS